MASKHDVKIWYKIFIKTFDTSYMLLTGEKGIMTEEDSLVFITILSSVE